jgi:hypothetical protein
MDHHSHLLSSTTKCIALVIQGFTATVVLVLGFLPEQNALGCIALVVLGCIAYIFRAELP